MILFVNLVLFMKVVVKLLCLIDLCRSFQRCASIVILGAGGDCSKPLPSFVYKVCVYSAAGDNALVFPKTKSIHCIVHKFNR